MKDNFTHVCFIIDESGSMYDSVSDVRGGFVKIIEEQKANTIGTCAVSMFTFNSHTTEHCLLKDVQEIDSNLKYSPGGNTALNDAVGIAITRVGRQLAEMPEEERPSSNLIVIMTDGYENASREYTLSQVKAMIKEQTDVYSWTFMYLGADITNSEIADDLGVKYKAYSTKNSLDKNYSAVNMILSEARSVDASSAYLAMDNAVYNLSAQMNDEFADETGIKLSNV